ncbi:MAG TPA: hypothetical protein VKA94_03530, partial [Hyphomicrobiales bacterium]|nr:hypothetical protein [Hyphomicrobiales bacterium]
MKFKSDFKDVHKAEKRSALLLFSGLFGLPLLTGFIAISSGASETAGLAVVIVTLIAFVGLAHWHEEGIKR